MNDNNYDVVIDADELDRDDDGNRVWAKSTMTCGRLTLDGVEVSWKIGDDRWDLAIPSGICSVFDLVINDARDFRSRADAGDIYDAVVTALQRRHHPDHCDCDACEERHRIQVVRICRELSEEGLTVTLSVPIQLKELGL